jgi:hypothetical protein
MRWKEREITNTFSARYSRGQRRVNYGREEKTEDVQDFADRRRERLPPCKLGVVVPTGFEPVFKDDYDFAL